jgi:hypothetical protein
MKWEVMFKQFSAGQIWETLRRSKLAARYDSERWANHVVDWLKTRSDVDAKRIGMEGAPWMAANLGCRTA